MPLTWKLFLKYRVVMIVVKSKFYNDKILLCIWMRYSPSKYCESMIPFAEEFAIWFGLERKSQLMLKKEASKLNVSFLFSGANRTYIYTFVPAYTNKYTQHTHKYIQTPDVSVYVSRCTHKHIHTKTLIHCNWKRKALS